MISLQQIMHGKLAHSNDAGHLYKLGLFLPLGKFLGLSPNCVSAGEPLTVRVKQSHSPVMVHSPLVFPERFAFPEFHSKKYITIGK